MCEDECEDVCYLDLLPRDPYLDFLELLPAIEMRGFAQNQEFRVLRNNSVV